MPAKLKYGNIGASGGKREGAGRKPNWFKVLCEKELKKDKAKAIRIIGEIARGEYEYDKPFNNDGEIIYGTTKPDPHEIIAAANFLRDSSFGKPAQDVQLKDMNGADISLILSMTEKTRKERGLDV